MPRRTRPASSPSCPRTPAPDCDPGGRHMDSRLRGNDRDGSVFSLIGLNSRQNRGLLADAALVALALGAMCVWTSPALAQAQGAPPPAPQQSTTQSEPGFWTGLFAP